MHSHARRRQGEDPVEPNGGRGPGKLGFSQVDELIGGGTVMIGSEAFGSKLIENTKMAILTSNKIDCAMGCGAVVLWLAHGLST